MTANTVTVDDIRNLQEKRLVVKMPNYHALVSARNQVVYARNAYPLPDGYDYATHTDKEASTIEIRIVEAKNKKTKRQKP